MPIRLAQRALDVVPGSASGCSRHDPTRFPAHAGRVPGPLRVGGGLPALPGGVPVAGRLPLPAMRRAGRLRAGRTGAPAVPGVPAPDLGDGGHGPAPDARPPPALVRGGLPGHHPHAGLLGRPAPAPARPRPVETTWTMLHKLRRAMVRPERDRLSGVVEVDGAYVG